MFELNRSKKRLAPLERPKLADLKVREREDLQEWLVNTPEALGEDFLIIQKEFDGFDGTRERLDLLAVDKDGRLVIIENKLDSGRDAVWQALKYAAYCSSLNKAGILKIYQDYLNQSRKGQTAEANLCNFFDEATLDNVELNEGSDQRLMLVAEEFRKEVTSTVLWLRGHGVQVQCIKVAAYKCDTTMFIDFQQVIPLPDAEDLMIGPPPEGPVQPSIQDQKRQLLRKDFWEHTLEELRKRDNSKFKNISPNSRFWLAGATGISGCTYQMLMQKKRVMVKLSLQRSAAHENRWIFDQLISNKQALEERFGEKLQWDPAEGREHCKIFYPCPFDSYDRENWPEMINWLCEHIVKLDKTFSETLGRLNGQLKAGVSPPSSDRDAVNEAADA